MVEVNMVYEGGLRCSATHGPSGASLRTDAPRDNHGQGQSFSPTDLVATALGSCMMTVMGIAAQRLGVDLVGSSVRVTKEMTSAPPRRIARLAVEITVPADCTPEQRRQLEAAAHGCPVSRSLGADVEQPVAFRWKTPAPAGSAR